MELESMMDRYWSAMATLQNKQVQMVEETSEAVPFTKRSTWRMRSLS
jgi:hypothetical protein